jgi:opacity protein-like surface antigen
MKRFASMLVVLACSVPAAAQDLQFRPFGMFALQKFDASETFDAVLGSATQPFWGGGLNITQDDRFYLEIGASRFNKTGQRAFVNNGQTFPLGIPVQVSMTPFEFTAGYRFTPSPRFRPYVGGGVGAYHYEESSEFSDDTENINTTHAGGIVEGGIEVRLHRWVGAAADVHYTYVPGILGDSGLSKDENEKNAGGFSFRVKVIIGK